MKARILRRLDERTDWRNKRSVYFALILNQMISDVTVLNYQVSYCRYFLIAICQFLLYFNSYILINWLNISPLFSIFLLPNTLTLQTNWKANVHETKLCVSSNLKRRKPFQTHSPLSNLDLMAWLWDSITPCPWQCPFIPIWTFFYTMDAKVCWDAKAIYQGHIKYFFIYV